MPQRLRILALEPYYGGSHAAFVDGVKGHSRHEWTLLAMPARKWKWRMRGAALHLGREAEGLVKRGRFDLVFACDFLAGTDWKALAPPPLRNVPLVTYFHENQLSYPLEPGQVRDYQYGLTNLTTCLASEAVWFNSAFHRDSFLAAADALLWKMPDFVPPGITDEVRARSRVLAPGVEMGPLRPGRERDRSRAKPRTILWSHRWEYDKAPEAFFEPLFFLAQEGAEFRVAVVGETFRKWPPVFEEAKRRLAGRLVQFGYLPERAEYEAVVRDADIVVSTAIHEFFGLSVVEAAAAGCFPLLPARLSYPEIIPPTLHDSFLYTSDRDLRHKLAALLAGEGPWEKARGLARHMDVYDWTNIVGAYDEALAEVAQVRKAKDASRTKRP